MFPCVSNVKCSLGWDVRFGRDLRENLIHPLYFKEDMIPERYPVKGEGRDEGLKFLFLFLGNIAYL